MMRVALGLAVLAAFTGSSTAKPILNGPLGPRKNDNTATTRARATYSVVNVDGSNIDGDCSDPRCETPTITVTKSSSPTTITHIRDPSGTAVKDPPRSSSVITIVPIDGASPITVTLYRPNPTKKPSFSSSSEEAPRSTTSMASEAASSTSSCVEVTVSVTASAYPSDSSTEAPSPTETTSDLELPSSSQEESAAPISTPARWVPMPAPIAPSSTLHNSAESSPAIVPSGPEPVLPSSSLRHYNSSSTFVPSSSSEFRDSDPPLPTTFLTFVSGADEAPSAGGTPVSSYDNGEWHSSKYPAWNGTRLKHAL